KISVSCSTAVVMMSVSASEALILASCALMSCAGGAMVSTQPPLILCSLDIFPEASAAPRAHALFPTRETTLPILTPSDNLGKPGRLDGRRRRDAEDVRVPRGGDLAG